MIRRTMLLHIFETCDKPAVHLCDTPRDHVGIAQISDPDGATLSLHDEIDHIIAITCADLEIRVAQGHLRDHGREVHQSKFRGAEI